MEHRLTLNDRLKASIEAESERRRRNLAAFLGTAEPVNGYDYRNQAWVMNGVYLDCHHAADTCSCYGRAHKGEVIAPDAEVR